MRQDVLESLSTKRVAVVGTARDCGATLRSDIARLREATIDFAEVSFFVVESDSRDDTVAVLGELAETVPNFAYRSMGALAAQHPARTDRLALCRNRYLQVLRDWPGRALDYVIISDLDGCNELLTRQGLLSCWETSVEWDVLTANQSEYYFDIWALRHDTWCPDDCWKQQKALAPAIGEEAATAVAVHAKMIHLDAGLPPVRVRSAFGGLGVYRYEALIGSAYFSCTDKDLRMCEHVALHERIVAGGGKIYINPAMINGAGLSHTINKRRQIFREAEANSLRQTFEKVYRKKSWGGGPESDFYSGTGSHDPAIVDVYVAAVREFLGGFDAKPDVVDLGCGDFNVGRQIRPHCGRYIACDVVPELVKRNERLFADADVVFRCVDIVHSELPDGDIAFIRQVLQHLSNDDIAGVVPKLGRYRWLVLTEHLAQGAFVPNIDRPTGKGNRLGKRSGVRLTEPPFDLKPIREKVLCVAEESGGVITTTAYQLRAD